MNPFETETMAELFLRQGHHQEARALYRRLLARTEDEAARERMTRRMAALPPDSKAGAKHPAGDADRSGETIPTPGVRAQWSLEELTIEWRLPVETKAPALEVLLVKTGAGGVSTERREIEVAGNAGRLKLNATNLHSVRVAAGSRGERGFVPLVRG